MDAPKRNVRQIDTQSLHLEVSRWMESVSRWLRQFDGNLSSDCTASRAWEMLTGARLENVAHHALYLYAHPPSDRLNVEERNVKQIDRKIKALMRAGRVAKDKRDAGDPRTRLFSDRYTRKQTDLLDSMLPFTFDESTVRYWVASRLIAGKPIGDLSELREAFASLGPRCPIQDRKFWLYCLRCIAANAGVKLGAERLAALANCSDPDSCDSRTLARYFKLFSSQVNADRRAMREVPLPLPLVPPQSF